MMGSATRSAPAEALRRAKLLATGVLGASIVVFVVARALTAEWPAMAYVAAFAEAAVIGGLADWYAVVALFRRPLGLPLPHTAIIPRSRDRIADRLGAFIRENFLDAGAIENRLKQVDFVSLVRGWLADTSNATALAGRLIDSAPLVLDAVERSGLRADLVARIETFLRSVDVSASAAALLRSPFVSANRQRLLDIALDGVVRFLSSPGTLGRLRDGLRKDAPALLKLAGADQMLFRRIVLAVAAFIEDIRSNPDHQVRRDFDAMFEDVLSQIESSPATRERLERLLQDLLSNDQIAGLCDTLWAAARRIIEERPREVSQALAARLGESVSKAATSVDLSPEQCERINADLRALLTDAITTRREEIGDFVAGQVRSWNLDDLVAIAETNLGPDLQYIRLNGALVGGLAGLSIFTMLRALGWQ